MTGDAGRVGVGEIWRARGSKRARGFPSAESDVRRAHAATRAADGASPTFRPSTLSTGRIEETHPIRLTDRSDLSALSSNPDGQLIPPLHPGTLAARACFPLSYLSKTPPLAREDSWQSLGQEAIKKIPREEIYSSLTTVGFTET